MATTKAKSNKKSVVLHDESINTYGFRMLTSGAKLEEFRKNPVMLYNHDDWAMPIGRWENIRIEDNMILADPVFDLDDPKGAEVARKWEKGFLKAASIGAWPPEAVSVDPALMLPGQELPTVTSWTVREASFCAIGSNHNALTLYDRGGKKIDLSDKSALLRLTDSLLNNNPKNKEKKMNKELLKKLDLKDDATQEEIDAAVSALVEAKAKADAENTQLKDTIAKNEENQKEAMKAQAVVLVDAAIKDGRLDASAKETTLKLFDADHENAAAMLSGLPKRQSVTDRIVGAKQSGMINNSDKFAGNWDELDEKGLLVRLRDEDPELFKSKFKERFGNEPK